MTERKPRPTAADFHPEVLRLFDVRARRHRPPRLPGGASRFAAGADGDRAARRAEPEIRRGAAGRADDARIDGQVVEFASPHGNGKAAATWCARAARRQAAGWCW